jgi:NAD(P)H-dependent flavin oxidoreductase YrpB (nitropropane dioxygenase family)
MCTVEAPIHQKVKEAIVASDENNTNLVLRRWKNTSRLFKNKVSEEALKVERESKTGEFAEVAPFVSGKRGREVFLNGDIDYGVSSYPLPIDTPCFTPRFHKLTWFNLQVWTAGQVIGLIHDIPTCADLLQRIEREAVEAIDRSKSLYTATAGQSKL